MDRGKTEARAALQALRGSQDPSGCSGTARPSRGVRGALPTESAPQTPFVTSRAGCRVGRHTYQRPCGVLGDGQQQDQRHCRTNNRGGAVDEQRHRNDKGQHGHPGQLNKTQPPRQNRPHPRHERKHTEP